MPMQLDSFLGQMLANGMASKAADRRQQAQLDAVAAAAARNEEFQNANHDRDREELRKDYADRPTFGHMSADGKMTYGEAPEGVPGVELFSRYMGAPGDDNVNATATAGSMRAGGTKNPLGGFEYRKPETSFNEKTGEFEINPFNSGSIQPFQHRDLNDAGLGGRILPLAEQLYNANKGVMGSEEAIQEAYGLIMTPAALEEAYPGLAQVRYDSAQTKGKEYRDDDDRSMLGWDADSHRVDGGQNNFLQFFSELSDWPTFGQQDRHMNRAEALNHYEKRYGIDPGLGAFYMDAVSAKDKAKLWELTK
jgi:hypothetical protein